ncbi:MAG: hypothetical protein V4486_03575 [Patescibacteria group bacterium]
MYTHNVVVIDKPEGQAWSPEEMDKLRAGRVVCTPIKTRPGRLIVRDHSTKRRIAGALGVSDSQFDYDDEVDVNQADK